RLRRGDGPLELRVRDPPEIPTGRWRGTREVAHDLDRAGHREAEVADGHVEVRGAVFPGERREIEHVEGRRDPDLGELFEQILGPRPLCRVAEDLQREGLASL